MGLGGMVQVSAGCGLGLGGNGLACSTYADLFALSGVGRPGPDGFRRLASRLRRILFCSVSPFTSFLSPPPLASCLSPPLHPPQHRLASRLTLLRRIYFFTLGVRLPMSKGTGYE